MHHLGKVLFTSELNNISLDTTDLRILFLIDDGGYPNLPCLLEKLTINKIIKFLADDDTVEFMRSIRNKNTDDAVLFLCENNKKYNEFDSVVRSSLYFYKNMDEIEGRFKIPFGCDFKFAGNKL
jgi:hypothetical protein